MQKDVMTRVPEKKISATVDSMMDDLEREYNRYYAMRSERNNNPAANNEFVIGLTKVRTLADEIIRWTVL